MDASFHYFRRSWAAFAILLFLATWKLWTTQDAFPRVPVSAVLVGLPGVIQWVADATLLASMLAVLAAPNRSVLWQYGLSGFVLSLLVLFAFDQHRFQPWAYQFAVIAVVLATAKPPAAFRLLRWLTIGIYAWSAWSKCDITFTHNLGQQFLNALFHKAQFESWPTLLRLVLASLFPVVEFAVAAALCNPRWWSKAVWASVGMHGFLIVVLGPLGLDHKAGVLLWNAYFVVQNLVLFRAQPAMEGPLSGNITAIEPDAMPSQLTSQIEPLPAAALCVVAAALIWPVMEPWSYCDHWPAWSVYAPRVERVSVLVHQSEQDRLPADLQPFLKPTADDENWLAVQLDRWSLAALDAPLYPQNRFQLAVAQGLAQRYGLVQIAVVAYYPADRWTGSRPSVTCRGSSELASAMKRFRLGTQADW